MLRVKVTVLIAIISLCLIGQFEGDYAKALFYLVVVIWLVKEIDQEKDEIDE